MPLWADKEMRELRALNAKLRTALDDLVELVREEHHGWPEFLLAEAAIANDEERG